jgi:ABC-2 type transport system permease protein
VVATVLRLRYRLLGNTLARSPWQMVGFIFGMLAALWVLGAVAAGLVAVSVLGDLDTARALAVVAGSLLVLGWVLGPLLIAGADGTVDAGRLAPFPLTRGQLMGALTLTGVTGIPGIATAVAAVSTIVLWVRWPAAAVVALPAIAIAVLTCVVASRIVTTLSTAFAGRRRGREIVGTVVLGLVIMAGPIMTGIFGLLDTAGDVVSGIERAGVILGWTPLGAAWAVPGDIAAGAWLSGMCKFAIAGATLAVLWVAWASALTASTGTGERRAVRAVKSGALRLFGAMPTGGVGATWARSLTAWLHDPRYLRQLIFIPLFPALFAFTTGIHGWLFGASALMVALIIAIAGYADVSYDGTAFASVLSTGVTGRADRAGRVLGAVSVGVPSVVAVAVVVAAIGGTYDRLPALLGAALGVLLAGYGVSAVSSALVVVPVPRAGDSPFKTVPGQTFASGMLVFAVMGACLVLAAPALILAAVAMATASALLGALALIVGVVVGIAVIVVGVMIGGRILDRTGPALLQRIKAFPI